MEITSGTTIPTKGIVSSLIPKTAPAKENSTVSSTRTILSRLPIMTIKRLMPVSTAPVAFKSQKAPPTTSMNMIIPACFTKPW